MVFALSRPYHLQPGRLPKQVALILDQTASMSAPAAHGENRFESAQRQARELIRQAPLGTEFLLAGLSSRPHIFVPFSRDQEKLLRTLDEMKWEASEVVEARPSLLPLVLSLKRSNPHCEVLLLGDQNYPDSGAQFLDCTGQPGGGQSLRNVAVTAFQVEEQSGHWQAFASFRSYSMQAETVPFNVLDSRGKILMSRTLPLPARGERTLNFEVPEGEGPFQLQLDQADDFEVDNSAWAVKAQKRRIALLLKGDVSPFLKQALLAQEGVFIVEGKTEADQTLCTVWGSRSDALPPGNHIMEVAPLALGNASSTVSLGPDPHSPLGQLPLGDLWATGLRVLDPANWCKEPLQPIPWLVQSEPGVAAIPNLGAGAIMQFKGRQYNILAFAFSLEESNLPLQPALPLLLARFLETIQGSSLSQIPRQLLCGQELDWASKVPLHVIGPGGQTFLLDVSAGKIKWTPTRPGVYRIYSDDEGPDRAVTVVANFFSAAESDLNTPGTALATATPAPTLDDPSAAAPRDRFAKEYWRWAVGGVLCLSLLEWLLYWRPGRS